VLTRHVNRCAHCAVTKSHFVHTETYLNLELVHQYRRFPIQCLRLMRQEFELQLCWFLDQYRDQGRVFYMSEYAIVMSEFVAFLRKKIVYSHCVSYMTAFYLHTHSILIFRQSRSKSACALLWWVEKCTLAVHCNAFGVAWEHFLVSVYFFFWGLFACSRKINSFLSAAKLTCCLKQFFREMNGLHVRHSSHYE